MAVTKPVRTAVLLCSMAVLLIGYQNCAVSLSGETPGASTFTCNPDTATLTQFAALESSILLSTSYGTHCATCHSRDVGNQQGAGQYTVLTNASPSSTSPLTLANFCAASSRGPDVMGVVFTNGHGGGNFSGDLSRPEFADLQTFIQNYL